MLIVLIIVVILIVGLLGIASTKPNTFRYERSTTINAPAEKIFPLIDNLHEWAKWSPYEKLDPNMKRTYDGPDSGVGAKYGWEGNSKAGTGNMLITESTPSSKILIRLEFTRPFKCVNTAEFTLRPTATGTDVTWALTGESPFINKVMQTIYPVDKMMGQSFEEGLASLKQIIEK